MIARRRLSGWGTRILGASIAACIAAISGCAPVALSTAREKMSRGEYAAAHEQLLALSERSGLSTSQRREVYDDLCLSEFMIGRPTYSLTEQRIRCSAAAAQPGSDSTTVLARIDTQIRDGAAHEVETALAAGDLSGAETAAINYLNAPGADRAEIEKWTPRMWALADREITERVTGGKKRVATAVAGLRGEYPNVKGMSKTSFEQWARKSSNTGATQLIARNQLEDGTMSLWVADDVLPTAALHLDEFATINSALAVRCGCSARTRVSGSNDLPVYLVYLDADLGQSDVFILPGARMGQPETAAQ